MLGNAKRLSLMGALRQQWMGVAIGLVAMFFVLGGTSVADSAIAHTSALISGHSIAKNSITGSQIKNNSLTGSDIKNHSLTLDDLRAGTFPAVGPQDPAGAKGDTGAKGDAGVKGDAGTNGVDGRDGIDGRDGVDGTNGVSGYQLVSTTGTLDLAHLTASINEACPTGKKVVGGGYRQTGGYVADALAARGSYPMSNGSGWHVDLVTTVAFSTVGQSTSYAIFAVCIDAV